MAVDYEEGRRLLAKAQEAAKAWSDAFNAFDPDAEKLERRMAIHRTILGGWMADHAEALLNPVSAAPSPAADEVEAIRARHEAALARMADNNWPMSEGRQDVAALLAMVDQMRVEK